MQAQDYKFKIENSLDPYRKFKGSKHPEVIYGKVFFDGDFVLVDALVDLFSDHLNAATKEKGVTVQAWMVGFHEGCGISFAPALWEGKKNKEPPSAGVMPDLRGKLMTKDRF